MFAVRHVPLVAAPALVVLAASCAAPPRWATHACMGDRPYVVQMPLHCQDPVDVVLGDEDHTVAIARELALLVDRSTGRSHEILAGLTEEFRRFSGRQRDACVSACQAWTMPCSVEQQASYQRVLDGLRGRNDGLRAVHARVDELLRAGRRIDGTDESTRRILEELESASDSFERASRPARIDLRTE
jgi:hypothetical protein